VSYCLRWTYFLATYLGRLLDVSRVGNLFYVELPFYLFLSLFTIVVAWWIEIYHFTVQASTSFLTRARWFLVAANVLLYLFLLVVVIAFATESAKSTYRYSLCGQSGAPDDHTAILVSKIFKISEAVIALVLAVGFIFYGTTVSVILSRGSAKNYRITIQFSFIAAVCAIALISQSVLLLYTTFAPSVNTVTGLLFLILVEIIPGIVLVASFRQPRIQRGVKDLYWCLLPTDGSTSTSGSVSSPSATTTRLSSTGSASSPSSRNVTSAQATIGPNGSSFSHAGAPEDSRF